MKIGINGFGRIGRTLFRLLKDHQVVGINDLSNIENLAYLLKYDSVYGILPQKVNFKKDELLINGTKVEYFSQNNISDINWKELGADLIIDSSGYEPNVIDSRKCGIPVVITHGSKDVDNTLVIGVNEDSYRPDQRIISSSTCTGNCASPVLKIIHEAYGIRRGFLTSIHPVLSYQRESDFPYKKSFSLGRGAASTILTPTRVTESVCEVLPELVGKLAGISYRVNSLIVLSIEMILELEKSATTEEINELFKRRRNRIICYADEPLGNLVSIDYKGDPHSAVFDPFGTYVLKGNLLRVNVWQDNEMGYAHRVLDVINLIENNNKKI